MKQLPLLIFILPLAVSCQINDYGSYHISLIGWAILIAIGIMMFLVLVLKKGVVPETEGKNPVITKGVSHNDFEPIGSYIGGHPGSESVIPDTVFRKNSDCCLFFYKDRSYNMPEFKFKIKVKSFKNISVEDLPSLEKKITSGSLTLTSAAHSKLKKKNGQLAFVTIDWTDGQLNHSTVFSFEGKDSMQKANIARDNFLRAVN
jgi:hypothetical protein